MINKKKIHFYQLAFISISLIFIILLFNWGYSNIKKQPEKMMSQSMEKMMSSMQLNKLTLTNLFKYEQMDKSSINTSSKHHENNNSTLKGIHYLTTVIIILLLPFIVAGTIFLAIMWLK